MMKTFYVVISFKNIGDVETFCEILGVTRQPKEAKKIAKRYRAMGLGSRVRIRRVVIE